MRLVLSPLASPFTSCMANYAVLCQMRFVCLLGIGVLVMWYRLVGYPRQHILVSSHIRVASALNRADLFMHKQVSSALACMLMPHAHRTETRVKVNTIEPECEHLAGSLWHHRFKFTIRSFIHSFILMLERVHWNSNKRCSFGHQLHRAFHFGFTISNG